eukprot:865878-Amphidinium_carterae.1
MELLTRLADQNIEVLTAGTFIYTGVRDSANRSQGFALLVAIGPAAQEANGFAAWAWPVGASDSYYSWWAEQKAGPALPPASLKVLLVPVSTAGAIPQDSSDTIVCQQYILLDPDLLAASLADHSFT